MSKGRSGSRKSLEVETLIHDEARRRNIPTAEFESVMQEDERKPKNVLYERRNRDLDPQLVWRGKDEQDWSDLVVQAPPLYIQEKLHPKVLIDDLRRRSGRRSAAAGGSRDHRSPVTGHQPDLFGDFNGLPDEEAKTEFYEHDQNWSNRMILGDSLQVMASLAEREGLRGKVQCIYIDPPYGIKFNSNFQWSTTTRDVKDGKADQITREPEQVKAFRDTWRDGIHSYLTYLRDRLTVARDLLADSGSVFVQIGDENVHRVRALMDEVFGKENFITEILVKKKGSQKSSFMDPVNDYILWYSRTKRDDGRTKFRPLFEARQIDADTLDEFSMAELPNGNKINLKEFIDSSGEKLDFRAYPKRLKEELPGARLFRPWPITNGGERAQQMDAVFLEGENIRPPKGRCWSHISKSQEIGLNGMERNRAAGRLVRSRNSLDFKRYLDDFPFKSISNWWDGLGGASNQVYVIQTNERIIERCILMTTDPGDLVLDPTGGSGTTAYVAEQWGRRWIAVDTSRVALALARARIMGARYPYYLLADSPEGQRKEAELGRKPPSDAPTHGDIRQGFVYRRSAYITSGLIANIAEIDAIWERFQAEREQLREQLNAALGQSWEEWEIPREAAADWPEKAKKAHGQWWENRTARQREIDASIAAKADHEYLYDKPYTDSGRIRVAGPFTVESLSPHRVLAVDQDDELVDTLEAAEGRRQRANQDSSEIDFVTVILENLKTSGVQQAHKDDKITFTALTGWPGRFICAEGRYVEGGAPNDETEAEADGDPPTLQKEKRAGIFIGPEFGTVSRQDLVAAAREAGDAGFDVLIACAFNYDAHSAELEKLGRIRVLKARMNADLHMSSDLKNTGKGNLFVIFGEPDIEVVNGRWLVTSGGAMVMQYDRLAELPGLDGLDEINRLGGSDLPRLQALAAGRALRSHQSGTTRGNIDSGKHSGGRSADGDQGVSAVPKRGERLAGGGGNPSDPGGETGPAVGGGSRSSVGPGSGNRANALRAHEIAAIEALTPADFPLFVTTDHWTQVTIHGVDVFQPQTGEIESSGPDGIACWFIDTDYNEESFFVRQAYFLGANDPYKALKTTLKAEIDEEAWSSLNSAVSRPFPKPGSTRIAVKVINHLGDEVMKVFSVR